MERITQVNAIKTPNLTQKHPAIKEPAMEIRIPGRGTTGMVRIGSVIGQIQQIINHPDRNRLMAELFKDYKKDYR